MLEGKASGWLAAKLFLIVSIQAARLAFRGRKIAGRRGRGEEEALTHKIGANADIKYLRKAMICFLERDVGRKKDGESFIW